jgi:hypothetical protein
MFLDTFECHTILMEDIRKKPICHYMALDVALDTLTPCNNKQDMMGNITFHKKVLCKYSTKFSHLNNGIG